MHKTISLTHFPLILYIKELFYFCSLVYYLFICLFACFSFGYKICFQKFQAVESTPSDHFLSATNHLPEPVWVPWASPMLYSSGTHFPAVALLNHQYYHLSSTSPGYFHGNSPAFSIWEKATVNSKTMTLVHGQRNTLQELNVNPWNHPGTAEDMTLYYSKHGISTSRLLGFLFFQRTKMMKQ